MKTLRQTLICLTLIAPYISITYAGVSSISQETVATEQEMSDYKERLILKEFINTYKKKHGLQKLENVYKKLSDERIALFPPKYRPYLEMIKVVLEQDFKIGQKIPTPAEIKSQGRLEKKTQEMKRIAVEERVQTQKKIEETANDKPSQEQVLEQGSELIETQKPLGEDDDSGSQSFSFSFDNPIDDASVGTQNESVSQGTIDVNRLQQTWLGRVNQVRIQRGLTRIRLSNSLHETARERSQVMMNKGVADHKRFAGSAYYAYREIVDRFEARGITFQNVNRTTFTENIGYARFTCDAGDCTDEAISAMRTVFDYFISEEGTAYDAHRRTIIQPHFRIMGLGIAVDEERNWLYVTQHYGTRIE